MLTSRALHILDILCENNRIPITSKKLSIHLGVSERSVKTYIKEVLEYCNKNGMDLSSKPGKGFVANFSNEQIEAIGLLHEGNNNLYSRKNRIAYILYILLCGWDTYTLSLFAEELFVSKKVISEDLDFISEEIGKYNLSITKVAGQGISLRGDEFDKRKALKEYCIVPMNNREVDDGGDYRIAYEYKSLLVNNYGSENFDIASDIVSFIEETNNLHFTDYSLRMLVSYMTIGFNRIRNDNYITEDIFKGEYRYAKQVVNEVVKYCSVEYGIELNECEKQYIDVLLGSAQIQEGERNLITREEDYNQICEEMLLYLSDILDKNFMDNELLKESICDFMPSSFTRTKHGIVISNPFYEDVKEMYSSVFATSFSFAPFYERYCGNDPTEQEISYLALYIGGAIVRTTNSVRAILIGTGGIAATSIVARKIENKIDGIEIVAILVSDHDDISKYNYDMILTMSSGKKYEGNVVEISPIISDRDIKKIRNCFFDIVTENAIDKENVHLFNFIDSGNMCIVDKKISKNKLLKMACDALANKGMITHQFYDDVLNREHIGATAIGNAVAIPHGKAENVVQPSVYIIKLKDKIDWGSDDVDIVFLLALNFSEVATTRTFFSEFTKLIETKENMDIIRAARTVEEMEKSFKQLLLYV